MKKLISEEVSEIRIMLDNGVSQLKIAKKFNIGQSQVSRINRKICWK